MNESPAIEATSIPREEPSALVHGTGWLTLSTVVVGLVNYLYALVLTRVLAVSDYATFAASQALLLIAGTVASTSVPWVLAAGLARSGPDRKARREVVWFATVTNLAQGLLAGLVVALIASRFAGWSVVAVVALSAFGIFLASTTPGWLQGMTQFRGIAWLRIAEVGTKVAVGAALVKVGAGAAGALAGFAAGALLLIAVGALLMRSDLRPSVAALRTRRLWRSTAGVGAIQGLVAVLASVDLVVVAMLPLRPADAASYQASTLFARVPLFLATAVSIVAFPLFSRAESSSIDLVRSSNRLYATLAVPVALVLVTMPKQLTGLLFPSAYDRTGQLLPLTAVAGALVGLVNLLTTFFQAHGAYRRCLRPKQPDSGSTPLALRWDGCSAGSSAWQRVQWWGRPRAAPFWWVRRPGRGRDLSGRVDGRQPGGSCSA